MALRGKKNHLCEGLKKIGGWIWAKVPACECVCVCVSESVASINYSNWQMATGRLVFWPITNGHTAGLNRASFSLGLPSWRLSHRVTSQDPKQSHRHRWGSPPEVNQNKQSPNVTGYVRVCVCVCLFPTYGQIGPVSCARLFPLSFITDIFPQSWHFRKHTSKACIYVLCIQATMHDILTQIRRHSRANRGEGRVSSHWPVTFCCRCCKTSNKWAPLTVFLFILKYYCPNRKSSPIPAVSQYKT